MDDDELERTLIGDRLAQRGILGGFDLSRHYPELGHALLVCATETKTAEQIATYRRVLASILAA